MENMKAHWEKYTALSEKLKDENIDKEIEVLTISVGIREYPKKKISNWW